MRDVQVGLAPRGEAQLIKRSNLISGHSGIYSDTISRFFADLGHGGEFGKQFSWLKIQPSDDPVTSLKGRTHRHLGSGRLSKGGRHYKQTVWIRRDMRLRQEPRTAVKNIVASRPPPI
jgi:hypothetical protein